MACRIAASTYLTAALGAAMAFFALPAEAQYFTVAETVVFDQKAVFATVETADVITARARIGGTITQLTVDEGAEVAEGGRIAVVADDKLHLQLKSLRARIDSAAAQRKLAVTALERTTALRQSGTVAQKRLDEAQAAFDGADRQHAALKAERDVILQQRAEGAVLAPASGRVLNVAVTNGAVVMPGEPVATIAAQGFILRMALPERHARFLKTGDVVRIGADGARTGTVRLVYPKLKQGRVIADVDVDGLGDYFVGERVRVRLSTGERKTVVVPDAYLFRRFGLAFVKLKAGGEAVVQTGRAQDGGIEVLSGLNVGDVLVKPE